MKKIFLLFLMNITLLIHAQNTLEKHYGDNVDCSGINVIQTFDNGFLITASKNPVSQYEDDLFIIKTNQIGDTLWTKSISLESGIVSKGIQTFDSGFVFTGRIDTFLLLYKVKSNGEQLWSKKYNFGTTYSFGRSIIESSNHNLFVVGENFIGTDVCCAPLVIKTDISGNLLETINLPYADYGRAYDIVETLDSNFVISYSSIINGPPIPKLTKVSKNGSNLWYKEYYANCECNVNLTHDNGFIISGSQIDTFKPYLIKTDSAGNVIWNKYNADYDVFNYNLKVTQANDDGYLMVGGVNDSLSDLILLKVNSLGDSTWGKVFGGSGDDFGNSIITTNDNGFAIVGYTTSFGSTFKEVYFLKTDSLGLITSSNKYQIGEKLLKIYPNPANNFIKISATKYSIIEVSFYDLNGQRILTAKSSENKIDISDLEPGLYFTKIKTNEGSVMKKIVVQ